jgi:hypothetical protein
MHDIFLFIDLLRLLQLYNYPKEALANITQDIEKKIDQIKNFSNEVIYSQANLQVAINRINSNASGDVPVVTPEAYSKKIRSMEANFVVDTSSNASELEHNEKEAAGAGGSSPLSKKEQFLNQLNANANKRPNNTANTNSNNNNNNNNNGVLNLKTIEEEGTSKDSQI